MIGQFRNVAGHRLDPVDLWPYEGMVEVIEHGVLEDWRPLVGHIRRHPWGRVARNLEDYLGYCEDPRLEGFFHLMLDRARDDAHQRERDAVVALIHQLVDDSGLSRGEFARQIGTSPSRLSTYLSGKVVPSATAVERMRHLVEHSGVGPARTT